MSTFNYQKAFPLQGDNTEYKKISSEYVFTVKVDGREILKIDPRAIELVAEQAMADVSFYLRTAHLEKVAKILDDPESTDNDRFVAYTLLENAQTAAEGELPSCQDTGTAVVMGKKGEDVYTGVDDAEALSKGIYNTFK
ncbi:MAG: fumarate hydratase class I, partial [Saprospiraceae bacterium]